MKNILRSAVGVYSKITKDRMAQSKSKGVTLAELVTVLVIIGILAAVALPQYNRIVERSRQAEAITMLGTLRAAQLRYYYEYDDVFCLDKGSCENLVDVPVQNGKFFDYELAQDTGGVAGLAFAVRNGEGQSIGSPNYRLRIDFAGDITCGDSDDCVGIPSP